MSESGELYATVNYIKHKVESLEKIEMLNLSSNTALQDKYIELLKSDDMLFQVYKLVDGIKAQKDIANAIGTNDMAVSRKVKKLEEYGLIEIKDVGINGKRVYKHSVAEQVFKLTRI